MSRELRIAVVHYHLKKGGVTRVIENTFKAFEQSPFPVKIGVLAGPPATDSQCPRVEEIPGLFYTSDADPMEEDALFRRLQAAAKTLLGGEPDLWHIHNSTLGKNHNMAGVIARLTETGVPLLFQLHDFAEDNRPQNYLTLREASHSIGALYPQAPHIGYAVINGRDGAFLKQAGLPPDRVFFLPNAVPPAPPVTDTTRERDAILAALDLKASDILLYPVRATRRKNLGEFTLWATLYSIHQYDNGYEAPVFLNTLGATNPDFAPIFERWKEYTLQNRLPVRFAVGESYGFSFESLVNASSALLTTSVAEGFGLGFLEPWTFNKSLIGRDLPDITGDFTSLGLRLPGMYERLEVPLCWCGGLNLVRDHLTVHMRKVYQKFGRDLDLPTLSQSIEYMLEEDRVDFGRLDEPLQYRVIEHLLENPGDCGLLVPSELAGPADEAVIANNRAVVEKHFNPTRYAEKLHGIYTGLIDASRAGTTPELLDPARVLTQFLDPSRFNLLRS